MKQISIGDTITLARTKLQAKRLILLLTILVSSLLFGIIIGFIIVSTGAINSAASFSNEAHNGHYLVKASPVLPNAIYGPIGPNSLNIALIDKLRTQETQFINEKKNQMMLQGTSFDPSIIPPLFEPDPFADKSLPKNYQVKINAASPVFTSYVQDLQRKYVSSANNKRSDLESIAKKYDATNYYDTRRASLSILNSQLLQSNKEVISRWLNPTSLSDGFGVYNYLIASARDSTYSFIDQSLVQQNILPKNAQRQAHENSAIPVIITAKEALALFGKQYALTEMPQSLYNQAQWLANMQKILNGATYNVCYRNSTDVSLIADIVQTNTLLEHDKSTAPSVLYKLPDEPCGSIVKIKDVRSLAEKSAEKTKQQQEKLLGNYSEPFQRKLTFQIVGIVNVQETEGTPKDINSLMTQLFSIQYGDAGAIIPLQMYEQLPQEVQQTDVLYEKLSGIYENSILTNAGIKDTVVAFQSAQKAKSFIAEQGCKDQESCDRPFVLTPYGSNYLLVEELGDTASILIKIAELGALILATTIIFTMIARIMIDSRRETAVFRALGAKRLDIAKIYITYTVIVSILITLSSLVLGISIALLLQYIFGQDITIYAKSVHGLLNSHSYFNFVDLTSPQLPWLLGFIILVCVIAALPPLIRNIRRNPINDIRDE